MSLMVQWLELCLPIQGVWVQSLVGKLRFHSLMVKKPKQNRNNIVTNSIKTLKVVVVQSL